MRKIILTLTMLLILTGCTSSKTLSLNIYKEAPEVEYTEINTDQEGQNLYYFYQKDCTHCEAIKSEITDFYINKGDVDFYLVDMAKVENNDAWGNGISNDPFVGSNVESYQDVKIQGTPTLVSITDNKIDDILVGEKAIVDYLATI